MVWDRLRVCNVDWLQFLEGMAGDKMGCYREGRASGKLHDVLLLCKDDG